MKYNARIAEERGMALVVALIFISVAILTLTVLGARLMAQRGLVARYEVTTTCFEGLEAAVADCQVEIEAGDDGLVGIPGNWTPTWNEAKQLVLPKFEESGIAPATMTSLPDVSYIGYTVRWANDGRDNNGDGIVDDTNERFYYTVYGAARHRDDTRNVEVVFAGRDVNVWRNAIFAGAGQAGGLINGNVSIHGSVHLLGNNLLLGAAALAAIDLSGTSLIHNNYKDVPAGLLARVPALPTTTFNGEVISTLEAKLRVKKGLVGMSGNSEIGEPNIFGNGIKETMDGVYVTDGYTGTSVVPDGNRGDPKNLWSDNGWDYSYDLGDKVSLPLLSDPWREPTNGTRITDPNTGTWYTHENYFSQVLLANPNNPTDGVFVGDMTLDAKGSNLYWNATQNVMSTTIPGTLPPATDDYIIFNSTNNTLRMNGQIRIDGKLLFKGQGNDRTINYSGRAAFLATGDVQIDTDLVSCNNGNPASTAGSFPVNNIIGIMTKENMIVGSTAQCEIMGAFYAEKKIATSKQTHVMGTFVSNYFDMGTNVPNIYQVPSLADNLPLGMVGNYPILSLSQVSWREL